MPYGQVLADTQKDSYNATLAPISVPFRNRIINGACVIDQRNAGASVTPATGNYTLDRWISSVTQASKYSVQKSSTAPAGFINSMVVTSLSAYSIVATDEFLQRQYIEGLNVADLGWGTASAQPVTLSFWVRSSLTGTFGGSLQNSATNRSYPFSYTINSANTFEYKTITIAGDTTGTWLTTNGVGIRVNFGLGVGSTYSGTAGAWSSNYYSSATGATSVVGTNGATFYITGVQLEKGSNATSFDYRPYGTELSLCQRYYWQISGNAASFHRFGFGTATATTVGQIFFNNPVQMRSQSLTIYYGGTLGLYDGNTITTVNSLAYDVSNTLVSNVNATVSSGLTQFRPYELIANNSSTAFVGMGAEL